jgi:predicted aminopeptidase
MKKLRYPLLITLLLLSNCGYLLKQGRYVLKYNSSAVEISEILEDSSTAPELRTFLERVVDIKRFAVEEIGLSDNGNYTRYVKVNRDYMADAVSAAQATRFEQYRWWYPFFGSFPYKGYFERKDAEREAKRLARKGYDTHIGKVDAFSTLGILKDPVYSFMKDYPVYLLASLIIHEQTHATIFIKSQVQFNEELATLVGNEGGLAYVESRFGKESDEYRSMLAYEHDYTTYRTLLKKLYDTLDTLYKKELPREHTISKKAVLIDEFKRAIESGYDTLFSTGNYKGVKKARINNAYLMVRMTYTRDLDLMYRLYRKHNSDLKSTVATLKTLRKKKGNPKEHLRKMLDSE